MPVDGPEDEAEEVNQQNQSMSPAVEDTRRQRLLAGGLLVAISWLVQFEDTATNFSDIQSNQILYSNRRRRNDSSFCSCIK